MSRSFKIASSDLLSRQLDRKLEVAGIHTFVTVENFVRSFGGETSNTDEIEATPTTNTTNTRQDDRTTFQACCEMTYVRANQISNRKYFTHYSLQPVKLKICIVKNFNIFQKYLN